MDAVIRAKANVTSSESRLLRSAVEVFRQTFCAACLLSLSACIAEPGVPEPRVLASESGDWPTANVAARCDMAGQTRRPPEVAERDGFRKRIEFGRVAFAVNLRCVSEQLPTHPTNPQDPLQIMVLAHDIFSAEGCGSRDRVFALLDEASGSPLPSELAVGAEGVTVRYPESAYFRGALMEACRIDGAGKYYLESANSGFAPADMMLEGPGN